MSRRYVFLVELTVYDPALPGTRVLRYATGTGFTSGASDNPAHTVYEPRLMAPAKFRMAVDAGVAQGRGQVQLSNRDRGLDPLYGYSFDGQPMRMLVLEEPIVNDPFPLAFAKEVLYAVMEQPTDFDQVVTITLKSPMYNLDQPLFTEVFAGTGGVEGGDDMRGKTKAVALGTAINFTPRLIDSTRLMYHLSCPRDRSATPATDGVQVIQVYDQGVALGQGANYANVADMLATAPAAGQFRILTDTASGHTGTYMRLGSLPTGQITATLLLDNLFNSWGNVMLGDLTKLNPSLNWPSIGTGSDVIPNVGTQAYNPLLGLYYDEPLTALEHVQNLLRPIRGWLVFYSRNTGELVPKYGIRYFRDPATAPANAYSVNAGAPPYLTVDGGGVTDGGGSILAFKRVPAVDESKGLPTWRVRLNYARNRTVQRSDLAGAVTAARRSYIAEEWRSVSAEDATIKTAWPLANDDQLNGPWGDDTVVGGAPTNTPLPEATRQVTLLKVRRDFFLIRVKVPDIVSASQLMIGDPMTVQNYPRFGCTVSRKFLILVLDLDYASGILEAVIWG